MKIILNWLRNILTAIKNFLWPFDEALFESTSFELKSESFPVSIWRRNERIEGDFILNDNDKLEGCNLSGRLTLDGNNITVDSCRVEGSLFITNLCTKGCKVKGNYLRANVYVSKVFEANDTNEFLDSNRVDGQVFRGEK